MQAYLKPCIDDKQFSCSVFIFVKYIIMVNKMVPVECDFLCGFISYLSYQLHCCTLPDKDFLSHGMCLYQVMMKLHFLNDSAYYAESTQKSKITS